MLFDVTPQIADLLYKGLSNLQKQSGTGDPEQDKLLDGLLDKMRSMGLLEIHTWALFDTTGIPELISACDAMTRDQAAEKFRMHEVIQHLQTKHNQQDVFTEIREVRLVVVRVMVEVLEQTPRVGTIPPQTVVNKRPVTSFINLPGEDGRKRATEYIESIKSKVPLVEYQGEKYPRYSLAVTMVF